jgi:hypothetical protein
MPDKFLLGVVELRHREVELSAADFVPEDCFAGQHFISEILGQNELSFLKPRIVFLPLMIGLLLLLFHIFHALYLDLGLNLPILIKRYFHLQLDMSDTTLVFQKLGILLWVSNSFVFLFHLLM